MWVLSGGFDRGLTFAGSWNTSSTFRLSYMILVERRERSDENGCLVAAELIWDTYWAPDIGWLIVNGLFLACQNSSSSIMPQASIQFYESV
jgi:hypothetical protein